MKNKGRRKRTPPEVRLNPNFDFDAAFNNISEAQSQGLVEAALEIARKRADALREIRTALTASDDEHAVRLMCDHVNIDADTRRPT